MEKFVESLYRHALAHGGKVEFKAAYSLYLSASGPVPEHEKIPRVHYETYVRELANIAAESRSEGVESRPQGRIGETTEGFVSTPPSSREEQGHRYNTFYRAWPSGRSPELGEQTRVTLHLKPRRILEVWRPVSKEMLPELSREVRVAKVAGPSEANRRHDSINVYTDSKEAADRVEAWIRERFDASYFRLHSEEPCLQKELSPGVSWAQEMITEENESLGQLATQAAMSALKSLAVERPGAPLPVDEALALLKGDLLSDALEEYGRNPMDPHLLDE